MKIITGDIWTVATRKDVVVVPTNLGWRDSDGKAVMGAGLARAAARRFPWLPDTYGRMLQSPDFRAAPGPIYVAVKRLYRGLVLFPTKPLDALKPYRSWMNKADPDLILYGLPVLKLHGNLMAEQHKALTVLPLLGCGCGELEESLVLPMLTDLLQGDHFILVRHVPVV